MSIDLLPHPDMFMDANIACSREEGNQRDDDGAKRVFFGGERFIEGISGQAYVMKICHFKLIPIYLDSYRVHIINYILNFLWPDYCAKD